ncbi:hypothetical protein C3747_332g9 [Trypanosoma cruzi]|uniref:Target of rapamycin (TOR) kinase 1 n=1 Tax=Trypanosoma cruzi TaxID=5693 RepID=A0A2V2VBV3_TRYCR|nr:hypothetical protein C3747_332g9 [Trypanosoma cruzi]
MIFITIMLLQLQDSRQGRVWPLHKMNTPSRYSKSTCPCLNLEWIKSRLNPATLERLMQVWGLVGRSPLPPSSSGKAREGSRRIPTADAHLLRKAGIIEDASSTITGGWIIPFSVVEEKTTGLRRTDRVATRQETATTLTRLMFLFYIFPIICRL